MRTTLTIDEDVASMLHAEEQRTQKPFKQVVNEALRRGLAPRGGGRAEPRYVPPVHKTRLAAGVDPGSLNSLADELETEAQVTSALGKR